MLQQIDELQTFLAEVELLAGSVINISLPARKSQKKLPVDSTDAAPAQDAAGETGEIDVFKGKYKRTTGAKKDVVRAFERWNITENDRITRIIQLNALDKLPGVHVIDASNPDHAREINALLKKKNLGPLSHIQIDQSVHYGMYDGADKLVTVMSTTHGCVGSYFKVIIMIEWIVGVDNEHNASYLVEGLKNFIAKKNSKSHLLKSYLCTQCWDNRKALKFWNGKLTQSNYSSVLIGLFYVFNEDFKIYEDARSMCS